MAEILVSSECSSPLNEVFYANPITIPENVRQVQKSDLDIKKCSEQFKTSIYKFVIESEKYHLNEINIDKTCNKYNFQKRRFYDVLNVLESIGYCTKISTEIVIWNGRSNIPKTFEKLQYAYKVNLMTSSLEDIFQGQQSIGISNLTIMFILCFLVMRVYSLDIKHVAMFLSRLNNRYKTTLCKLYQITHILESAGIISRSLVPCVFILNKDYVRFVDIGKVRDEGNPLSIANLLNDHSSINPELVIEQRRIEFFMGYKKLATRPYHYRTKIPNILDNCF